MPRLTGLRSAHPLVRPPARHHRWRASVLPSSGPLRPCIGYRHPRPSGPGCSAPASSPARFRFPVLGPLPLSPPSSFSLRQPLRSLPKTACLILHSSTLAPSENSAGHSGLLAPVIRRSVSPRSRESLPASAESASFPFLFSILHLLCLAATAAEASATDAAFAYFNPCVRGVGSLSFTHARGTGKRRPCRPTGIQPLLAFARALSVCLRYCHADSGGPHRHPKVPALSRWRHPPRRMLPRSGSRRVPAYRPFLPG